MHALASWLQGHSSVAATRDAMHTSARSKHSCSMRERRLPAACSSSVATRRRTAPMSMCHVKMVRLAAWSAVRGRSCTGAWARHQTTSKSLPVHTQLRGHAWQKSVHVVPLDDGAGGCMVCAAVRVLCRHAQYHTLPTSQAVISAGAALRRCMVRRSSPRSPKQRVCTPR